MEKKPCYGLDIPVEGKPKWIYENPYRYIEKLGCEPVEDYFLARYMEEEAPLDNPLFIDGPYGGYNVIVYSVTGEKSSSSGQAKNVLASCFCGAFIYGASPCKKYPEGDVYGGMILLPSDKAVFTKRDRKELRQLLKDLEWLE